MFRPSNLDAPAPIGRPRRLARGKWTPPGSVPPANPGIAQSARPIAVTAREFVAGRAAPAEPVAGLARLDGPTHSEGRPRTIEARTGKPKSVCPIETWRTLRR